MTFNFENEQKEKIYRELSILDIKASLIFLVNSIFIAILIRRQDDILVGSVHGEGVVSVEEMNAILLPLFLLSCLLLFVVIYVKFVPDLSEEIRSFYEDKRHKTDQKSLCEFENRLRAELKDQIKFLQELRRKRLAFLRAAYFICLFSVGLLSAQLLVDLDYALLSATR